MAGCGGSQTATFLRFGSRVCSNVAVVVVALARSHCYFFLLVRCIVGGVSFFAITKESYRRRDNVCALFCFHIKRLSEGCGVFKKGKLL